MLLELKRRVPPAKVIAPLVPSAPLLPSTSTPAARWVPPPQVLVPLKVTLPVLSLVSMVPAPVRLALIEPFST